jgi:hypothetical protein
VDTPMAFNIRFGLSGEYSELSGGHSDGFQYTLWAFG